MSRFLLVVPPLTGHVLPTVGIGRELAARGHQVAWTGSEPVLRPLLGPQAEILPTGSRLFRAQGGHGLAAVRSLWEGFVVPYARFTAKALDQAVQDYRPEVLLVDQHTPAGALVAHRHGLRWASLAPGAMELGRPFRALPRVEQWMEDQLRGLWQRAGLPAGEFVDPRFSPELVLALTGPALTGAEPFPAHYALVGPVLAERPADPGFPWERLEPGRRRVLLTMGTLAADVSADFHARALEALARCGEDVQAVIAAPPQALGRLPERAVAVERAPVLELMARGLLDAVVCHGGMNTVGEALSHGIPLVVAPIRHDQPFVAAQLAAAGAGVRVPFDRVAPDGLAAALRSVLDDPGYREAAVRTGADLRSGGGAHTAVDRLEQLAAAPNRRNLLV
ncbi:glycosyltransferase family 1 protein [Streptacidiphilus sp. PB12-B1b]|uniref:glycosyltransferase n=1 Tax=Streptacidiphilus sp. PB12-B1b TaxID=2705012 RepID=UPI0015F89DBE|nr:glycosyltransferase [Streptacidiphilus sp. PB12-B1b]QMU76568.1 glycosyltransferase family 1 protein [Streptacidiphilus sp. PB12-B1b]